MESAKIEGERERWHWAVIGLMAVSIVVAAAPLLGGAGGWMQKWAVYLAGADFFCVAAQLGECDGDEA